VAAAAAFSKKRLSLTVMVERGPKVGPRHLHGGTAMEHYAAIDVSLEWSSVCIVDDSGRIVREAKVRSERAALVGFFAASGLRFTRIGLEAGSLSQWLHAGLVEAGLPAILIETRHVKAEGDDREDRPERCAWDSAADAHGLVSGGPCQGARGAGDPGLLTARKLLIAKLRDHQEALGPYIRDVWNGRLS
jgi:hypothetical protein